MKQILEYLQSFVVIGLVLAGIGGLSYHLFREEGWIENALGNIWDLSVQYPLIVVTTLVGAVLIGKAWRDRRIATGRTSRLPDFIIYALMAAGVFFIGRFFVHGTF
jgi:hypothetical protein